MKYSIIAAMDDNNLIGNNNELPWNIPEDLKWFQKCTINKPIIMGKNTWESLGSKPLTNRLNLIVSKSMELPKTRDHYVFRSVRDATKFAEKCIMKRLFLSEIFYIGGRSIYAEALSFCTHMYITHVDGTYSGNVYFPEFSLNTYNTIYTSRNDGFTTKIYEQIKRNNIK